MHDTIKRVINEILDSEEKKLKEEFRKNSSFVNQ
jgi:ribosomal protein S17E